MDIEGTINKVLQNTKEKILKNLSDKGKVVSGKTASLFEVKDNALLGPVYYESLENGRKGGKIPYGFKDILLRWAASKGLSFESDAAANRWAYLTSKKIREEGTEQYRQGIHLDIYTSPIEDAVEELNRELNKELNDYIIDTFKD